MSGTGPRTPGPVASPAEVMRERKKRGLPDYTPIRAGSVARLPEDVGTAAPAVQLAALCPQCGKRKKKPGKSVCEVCRAAGKTAPKCTGCHKRLPVEGGKLCAHCRERSRKKGARHRGRAAGARKQGPCAWCGRRVHQRNDGAMEHVRCTEARERGAPKPSTRWCSRCGYREAEAERKLCAQCSTWLLNRDRNERANLEERKEAA